MPLELLYYWLWLAMVGYGWPPPSRQAMSRGHNYAPLARPQLAAALEYGVYWATARPTCAHAARGGPMAALMLKRSDHLIEQSVVLNF